MTRFTFLRLFHGLLLSLLAVLAGCGGQSSSGQSKPKATALAESGLAVDLDVSLLEDDGSSGLTQESKLSQARPLSRNRVLRDMRFGSALPSRSPASARFLVFVSKDDDKELGRFAMSGGKMKGRLNMAKRRARNRLQMQIRNQADEILARINLPPSRRARDRRRAMNLFRRANGSMLTESVELDENGEPDKNSPRQVTDNGYDMDGDGKPDTTTRLDYEDGYSVFDSDGDGQGGGPGDRVDLDGDGKIEPGEGAVLFDPDLDGVADSPKDAGLPPAEDSVRELSITVKPEVIRQNGEFGSVTVTASSEAGRMPFGATFQAVLVGGKFLPDKETRRTVTFESPGAKALDDGSISMKLPFIAEIGGGIENVVARVTLVKSDGASLKAKADIPVDSALAPEITGVFTVTGELRAGPGSRVVIAGKNLVSGTEPPVVSFAGVEAGLVEFAQEQIIARVPSGASRGPITVDNAGLLASTENDFEPLPDIAGTTPENNATDVNPESPVSVLLAAPAAGLTSAHFRLETQDGAEVPSQVAVSDDGTLITITPDNMLDALTIYRVRMLPWESFVTFLTGSAPDRTPPSVVSVSPVSGAILTDAAPTFTITFDEPLSISSVRDDAVRLTAFGLAVSGKVTYVTDPAPALVWGVTETVSTSPAFRAAGLLGGGPYTLSLDPTIADESGNAIGVTATYAFTASLRGGEVRPSVGLPGGGFAIIGGPFTSTDTVTLGGLGAPVTRVETNRLFCTVPEGAVSGEVAVTSGESSVTGPNFVVTDRLAVVGQAQAAGPYELTVESTSGLAYVVQQEQAKILELSLETGLPTGRTLTLAGIPTDVVPDGDGATLFVPNFGTPERPGATVTIIDREDLKITGVLRTGKRPVRVAFAPATGRLFVSDFADGTISVFNASEKEFIGRIEVGNGPNGIALAPDGKLGAVCNFGDDTVSLFDAETLDVIGEIAVGEEPVRAAISPDGTELAVTGFADGTITIVALPGGEVRQTITAGLSPLSVAYRPDGARLMATLQGAGEVKFWTAGETGWTLTGSPVSLGIAPAGLEVSADGSFLVSAAHGSSLVSTFFLENPAPVIESLSRQTADPGATLTILGGGFSVVTSENIVMVGGAQAEIAAAGNDPGTLVVTVPATAENGAVTVTRDGVKSNAAFLEITTMTPELRYFSPQDGAPNVELQPEIVAAFSEPMDPAAASPGAVTVAPSAGSAGTQAAQLRTQLSDDGRVLMITPLSDLAPQTEYLVTVTTTLRDIDGNAFDADSGATGLQPFTFRFTTRTPPPALVTAVAPPADTVFKPGEEVTISGTGFKTGTEVFVAGIPAQVTLDGETSLRFVIPTDAPEGQLDVLILADEGSAELVGGVRVAAGDRLAVVFAEPADIPQSTGGEATLFGSRFIDGMIVTVTDQAATQAPVALEVLSVTSETEARVKLPAGIAPGFLTITVTRGSETATASGLLRYTPPPTLTGVDPNSGALAGGSNVIVSGGGFTAGTTVLFGTLPATIVDSPSDRLRTVVAPPATAEGFVSVTVKNPDGQQATLADAFRYVSTAATGLRQVYGEAVSGAGTSSSPATSAAGLKTTSVVGQAAQPGRIASSRTASVDPNQDR